MYFLPVHASSSCFRPNSASTLIQRPSSTSIPREPPKTTLFQRHFITFAILPHCNPNSTPLLHIALFLFTNLGSKHNFSHLSHPSHLFRLLRRNRSGTAPSKQSLHPSRPRGPADLGTTPQLLPAPFSPPHILWPVRNPPGNHLIAIIHSNPYPAATSRLLPS